MIELPGFLRNYRRDRRAVAQGQEPLPPDAHALYIERISNNANPEWQASPRGKWVAFQLRWIEERREYLQW